MPIVRQPQILLNISWAFSSRTLGLNSPLHQGGASERCLRTLHQVTIFSSRRWQPCVRGRLALSLITHSASVAHQRFKRFSNHPDIVELGLPPNAFGIHFYNSAMSSLGQHIGKLSRENIFGFLLLSLGAFGRGQLVEMRMLIDLAVRMSLDMGLHMVNHWSHQIRMGVDTTGSGLSVDRPRSCSTQRGGSSRLSTVLVCRAL